MKLKDRVAIITGAASGIGRATALLFAAEGAKIVVADVNIEGGEETVAQVAAAGGESVFIYTDVTKSEVVSAMVEETRKRWGGIDILYNNAAATELCNVYDRPVHELDEEIWDKMLDICLKGVYLCSKYVLPVMMEQNRGIILNTTSNDALLAEPGFDSYTAAKGGVISLTRSMATEYAEYNIRVNTISPGYVITECQMGWYENQPETRSMVESYHLTRLGVPDDIAQLALFLASDESAFITGALIPIDGGYTAFKGAKHRVNLSK